MAALATGLAIAAFSLASPEQLLLFSDARGRARLMELLQAGSPLAMTLPGFTTEDWVTALSDLWPWLAAAAGRRGGDDRLAPAPPGVGTAVHSARLAG